MRKSFLAKATNVVINGTCSTLGALHFIAQTSADVVMHAEAKIQRRRYGADIEETKRDRLTKTVTRQVHIAEKVEAFQDAIRLAKAKAMNEPLFETETSYDVNTSNLMLVNADQVM